MKLHHSDDIEYEIAVVCTDAGQHKRVRLATIKWKVGAESWWMPWLNGKWAPPDPEAEPGEPMSTESYGFVCPICPRWPKIGRERWRAIVEGARRAGLVQLDVSMLD